jgi:hypothetical protein
LLPDIKLRNLRGAVCLQSLSDSQIQHYLGSLKRPELWEAIQTTPSLQAMLETTTEGDPGLLRVPLFVKLVADVYDPQQPISSKADLLDKYIDRQLSFDKREIDRRKELDEYKWAYKTVKLEPAPKKTSGNLCWLARNLQSNNKVEFLIEYLQPSSINPVRLPHRYRLIFGSIFGLIGGLTFGLIGGLNYGLIKSLHSALIFGPIGTFIFSLIFLSTSRLTVRLLLGGLIGLIFGSIIGLIQGLNIWLTIGFVYGLMGVVISWMIGSIVKIETLETFQISKSKTVMQEILRDSIFGLMFGSIFAGILTILSRLSDGIIIFAIIGMFIGSIYGAIVVFKKELKIKSKPNQGIYNSLQSQLWMTIIIMLAFIPFSLTPFSFIQWQFGLFIALFFGFAVGGGKACLQHLSLRIVLWQSGLPWNFSRFLNYCVERRLLLRVGGSYRFLHRELLDHFAQSNR